VKKLPELGVGLLIHYSEKYKNYLEHVNNHVDFYELLLIHFSENPNALKRVKKELKKPLLLHSAAASLATDGPVNETMVNSMKERIDNADAPWYSEHLCFTGVSGLQAGTLVLPIMTEESLNIICDKISILNKKIQRPLLIENVVNMYNDVGDFTHAEFINEVLKRTDSKLLLSVENMSMSKRFYPEFDHYKFIDELETSKIAQIHCPLGNLEEQKITPDSTYGSLEKKQQLHFDVLNYLAKEKKVKPNALVWELETETNSIAEPKDFINYLEWSKDLFFNKEVIKL
jgi:uncharacterized protein